MFNSTVGHSPICFPKIKANVWGFTGAGGRMCIARDNYIPLKSKLEHPPGQWAFELLEIGLLKFPDLLE